MLRLLTVLVDLCRAGRKELIDAFFEGRLDFRSLWTAAEGAAVCVAEIATKGEDALVDDSVAAARLEQECLRCAHLTRRAWHRYAPTASEEAMSPQKSDTIHPGETVVVRALYCGPAMEDRTGTEIQPALRTCGCLVGQEVGRADGERIVSLRVLPACATVLKSKSCPQGRW